MDKETAAHSVTSIVDQLVDLEALDQNSASPNSDFEINDERGANWVVRKVIEARQYAEHVEQWAAAEITRAQAEERRLL